MTDDDPLEGADIGESVTVEHEETFQPDVPLELIGSDRITDAEVTDVEIEDRDVTITWEAELTKQLPRNWDYCREPRTEAEAQAERRRKWARRLVPTGVTAAVLAVGSVIAYHVTSAVFDGLTINGEPMSISGPRELIGPLLLIVVLAYIIGWGVHGGFPRRVGGVRR